MQSNYDEKCDLKPFQTLSGYILKGLQSKFCIQEDFRAGSLELISALFRPPLLKQFQVSRFILALSFPCKKCFCIFFSSITTLFGTNVINAKSTNCEIASDLNILPVTIVLQAKVL